MSRLTIEYPEDLLIVLGTTPEAFEQKAHFALAAKLFELGRLSSGKAAELAGLSRMAFLSNLHRVGVAAINPDARELEDELRYARDE